CIISLAGVSDFKARFPKGPAFDAWKKEGVYFVENGRTHQQMPHYFQFYEDFIKNEERLTIERATRNLKIPHLIIHGNNDTSVSIEEARVLHKWNPKSKLAIIDGANHVFGTSQPWQKSTLPPEFKKAVSTMIDFIKT
ncbi:MAG TPA: alpha/beta hydrolase, partial [Flavobacteriaceae bacterium]|nr:alpha/beta hydrolase [Flavobacteriaceae bacterium]